MQLWIPTGCALLLGIVACSSNDRESIDQRSFASCEDPSIDTDVRAIQLAARDVAASTERLQSEVLSACSGIARELGAADTWTEVGDPNLQLSNPDHGGACDQVSSRVRELLPDSAPSSTPLIAIGITRGECNLDFQRQTACDIACSANVCDSGTIVTRCPESELSALCDSSCGAESSCMGTLSNPTICIGRCESDCVGNCHGTCFDSVTGEVSADPVHCNGKCDATCEGECRGVCHVGTEQGIACGTDVRCVGGCNGAFSQANCQAAFLPPSCDVDVACHASCSASVLANPSCAPTTVLISVSANAPELAALAPALKAHLPSMLEAAGGRGALLRQSGERVRDTALELDHGTVPLDEGSRACLRQSIERVTWALSDLNAAVTSSQEIQGTLHNRSH